MWKNNVFLKSRARSASLFLAVAGLLYLLLGACPSFARDVSFTWSANPENVDGYRLYYKTGTSGPPYDGTGAVEGPSSIDTGNVTTFTLHGLADTETYYFALTAYLGPEESGYSAEIMLPPPTPSQTGRTVSFVWSPNPETVDGYKLYYEDIPLGSTCPLPSDQPFNSVDAIEGPSPVTTGNVTTYTLQGLAIDKSYCFALTAYLGNVESDYTQPIQLDGDNPPVASNAFASTTEDKPVSGILPASDPDGDALTYSIVNNGTIGTAQITNASSGAYTYTPNPGVTGDDSFTFRVNDGRLDSDPATVSVRIAAVNKQPVATDSSLAVTEDTPASGQLSASDPDGDALTYKIIASGTKGNAVITNSSTGSFTYTPNQNATGSDTFTFLVNDGALDSNVATVAVSITPVNDAPVSSNSSFTTAEDTAVTGQLSASDPEGDALSYSIIANGSLGTAVITNPSTGAFTYTPDTNANGSDSFTFRVNDGKANSNTATVTITITPVNDPPVAAGSSLTTKEDTVLSGQLTANDPDGDGLTYSIVTNGTLGTAVLTNPSTGAFTYTPDTNTSGNDSFTFRVNDGKANSNTATVAITITPVNDPPVAAGSSLTTKENTVFTGQLTANDPDGDGLTFSIVTNGTLGTAVLTDPSTGAFTYTPDTNASGSDSFTFRANDGTAYSNTATVAVTITPVNEPPVAAGSSLTTKEDTVFTGQLTANDPDGDGLTYSIVTNGTQGTAVLTDPSTGAFTYTPNTNASGSDSFAFRVNDGTVDSNTATVAVTITPVNKPPTAADLSITTEEDTSVSGQLSGSDLDGDPLTYSIVANGTLGTVVMDNQATGAFTYSPDTNATGSDSFTYVVNDGIDDSNVATVSVTVTPVNDVPTAVDTSLTTEEDTPVSGQMEAADADGDTLTYTVTATPSLGTLEITNPATGGFTYTPKPNVAGEDSFTFLVNDGTADSGEARVAITITPVNDQPVAGEFSISTNYNTSYTGRLYAGDTDGDPLSYSIVRNGNLGTATITDPVTGAFTYTPDQNASGSDSFTFIASDGTASSAETAVNVTIFDELTLTGVFGDTKGADYPGTLADTYTNTDTVANGAADTLRTYSLSSTAPHKPASTIIIKADLADIPAFATIIEARLYLYQSGATGETAYVNTIHKIIGKNPVISEVTGYSAFAGESWTPVPEGTTENNVPLGLADIDALEDSIMLFKENGYRSWVITRMVQDWVNTPASNYGLLIKGEETSIETGRFFGATDNKDAGVRPKLVVKYRLIPPPPNLIIIEEIK